jgi:hypothetical protein
MIPAIFALLSLHVHIHHIPFVTLNDGASTVHVQLIPKSASAYSGTVLFSAVLQSSIADAKHGLLKCLCDTFLEL